MVAKKALRLEAALRRLDRYAAVILDDFGYVQQDREEMEVLFTPTFKLVQELLAAKKALRLDAGLRRLDRYAAVILDDFGNVQQDREEMEVLFTFLAERYERRSVLISSNLIFSKWDQIFKDPMTTMAAIDRLVHHAVILEFTGPSIRELKAKERKGG